MYEDAMHDCLDASQMSAWMTRVGRVKRHDENARRAESLLRAVSVMEYGGRLMRRPAGGMVRDARTRCRAEEGRE